MKAAPVRGTQSFVGVMAEVFKRPSLVGIELGWRGVCGLLLGLLAWRGSAANVKEFVGRVWLLRIMAMHRGYFAEVHWMQLLLSCAGIAMVWALVAGLGRGTVLRRCEPRFEARAGTVVALSVLRVWVFVAAGALWVRGFASIYMAMIRQEEPNYVWSFAQLVVMTLVMFVVWCTVSWVLQVAPIMAMGRGLGVVGSVRAAWRSGELRGKLVEINLVMGIVKVALVVLALVFSACPLPFSNVETQEFLNWWWVGVGVLWVVASDYFHVVRAAAYLRLWQAYELPSSAEAAS